MSSYLTFYLVPKKEKNKWDGEEDKKVTLTQEPLSFLSYSRSSEIYQAYNEAINPIAFCNEGNEYTELTVEKANEVVRECEKSIKDAEDSLKIEYKILKEGGYSNEVWVEIHSKEDYLKELRETLSELKFIAYVVEECTSNFNDFEKVLINIG